MRRNLLSFLLSIAASITFSASSVARGLSGQESTGRPRQTLDQQTSNDTRYVVQLGASFATAEKANEVMSQLRRKYPTAYTHNPIGSETVYRVRIGPFNSREEALQVAGELANQGFQGATVSRLRAAQKPSNEPPDNPPQTTTTQDSEEMMRRAITNLSTQLGLLTDEIRNLRRETERNSEMMELLLNEDRLAKVEDKIQDAAAFKAQLDAREQDILRRTRNIQGELVLSGGLRRDESETAIRSELQRALEEVHTQQSGSQQRIVDLNEQAARLRARVETLRKKLELIDVKSQKEEK